MRLVAAALTLSLLSTLTASGEQAFDAKELATYRLTEPVLARFAHATRLIAKELQSDLRYQTNPLLTRAIVSDGDAAEMAATLQQRLDGDAALSSALFGADMSSREYATFAIALFGARMAHGFVESGAIRRVPAGVASANVAFVDAHERAIVALLKQLNLE